VLENIELQEDNDLFTFKHKDSGFGGGTGGAVIAGLGKEK
jgi:hypothetical protein